MDCPNNESKQSKNINISPKRQNALINFIHSLPRLSSPTLFKISNDETNNFSIRSPNSNKFNWSLEEYSTLYGNDFTNYDEQNEFDLLLSSNELITRELNDENEKFFSQEKILLSPAANESDNTSNNSSIIEQNAKISRNTESFLLWLDSLPFLNGDPSTDQPLCDTAIAINDVSMKTDLNNENITYDGGNISELKFQFESKYQTDSDFVSMNNDTMNTRDSKSIFLTQIENDDKKLSFIEMNVQNNDDTPKIRTYRHDYGISNLDNNNVTPIIFPIDEIAAISPIAATSSIVYANKENVSPKSTNRIGTIEKRSFIYRQYSSSTSSSSKSMRSTVLINNHNQHLPSTSFDKNDDSIINEHFKTPQTTRFKRIKKLIPRGKLFFPNEINCQSTPNHQ